MDFERTLAGAKACPNCGTLPASPGYCVQCGQDNRRERLRLDDIARDALAWFTDLDRPFLRTLTSLFPHCGEMASDFVAGRRARFVGPVRLFLALLLILLLGQDLMSDHAPGSARWLPLALLLYVLPLALVFRLAFFGTRRTLAEVAVFVLYAISGLLVMWMTIGLSIVIGAGFGLSWGTFLWVLGTTFVLGALYLGASTKHFFHSNILYALLTATIVALLMGAGFGTLYLLVPSLG